MDDHNIHQFWGFSPAADLLALTRQVQDAEVRECRILQVRLSLRRDLQR
jgi:hypothetical protein